MIKCSKCNIYDWIKVATTRWSQKCRFGKWYSIWGDHQMYIAFYGLSIYISHSNCTNLFDSSGISTFSIGIRNKSEWLRKTGKKCKRAQILSLLFYDIFRIFLFIRKISRIQSFGICVCLNRPISSSIRFCLLYTHTYTHTIRIQHLHNHRLHEITTLLFTYVCLCAAQSFIDIGRCWFLSIFF